MDIDTRVQLITSRLKEVMGVDQTKDPEEQLRKCIESKTNPHIYWGTAPTGTIHLGYLVPLLKIADFLKAGCEVTILIADVHALLDNLKTTPELVEYRTFYYTEMIRQIMFGLNIPITKLKFVNGSTFQLSEKYVYDLYKLSTLVSQHDAKRGGSEVVKQTENPKLSGLIYPLMQALDEEYLGVDIQFGGVDQRKIFTLAVEYLPLIGYKKRIHIMNPMLISLSAKPKNKETVDDNNTISQNLLRHKLTELYNKTQDNLDMSDSMIISNMESLITETKNSTSNNISETKMSSSNSDSKIDFLDTPEIIKKKINGSYCLEGNITFNPLMELVENVIFPMIHGLDTSLEIKRPEKYGGLLIYSDLNTLKDDFVNKKLHPQDLKNGVASFLAKFTEPIRKYFDQTHLKKLMTIAY